MTNYTATVTVRDTIDGDEVVSALVGLSPVWQARGDGRADVILSLDAGTLLDAATRAVVLVEAAAHASALRVDVLPSDDFDREADAEAPTMSVSEAAEALGTSRQAVLQRISSGSLPATRVGRQWTIPATAVERVAGRS